MDAFISAFIGSVLSTLPIGPINFILIHFAIERRWKDWLYCVSGVIAADAGVSLLGLYIWKAWEAVQPNLVSQINTYGSYFLAVILGGIGLQILAQSFRVSKDSKHSSEGKLSRAGAFFLAFGFIATLLEPGLPVFWLGWWMETSFSLADDYAYIVSGLIAGDSLVFLAYGILACALPKPSPSVKRLINRLVGICFLGVAFSLLILS